MAAKGEISPKVQRIARAKVNLALHVVGRRADGYHLLDSLVAFADFGDVVTVEPAPSLSLSITGPMAAGLSAGPDNLVLKAAQMLGRRYQQYNVGSGDFGQVGGRSDGRLVAHGCLGAHPEQLPT